jgi:hypothetical protein
MHSEEIYPDVALYNCLIGYINPQSGISLKYITDEMNQYSIKPNTDTYKMMIKLQRDTLTLAHRKDAIQKGSLDILDKMTLEGNY